MTADNIVDVTADNFESIINNNEIIIMDFWAEWCGPCKQFGKVFAAAAAKHPGIVFAKVDVQAQEDLANSFQIRSIPHIMIFKQGIVIYSDAGSMPESALNDLLEQAKAADVSSIKAQLEDDENA